MATNVKQFQTNIEDILTFAGNSCKLVAID